MTKDCSRGVTRSKWFLPAFSLVLGLVMLAVSWLGGSLGQGLISLAVLAAFGLVILLAGRSETVRGLRGDGRDERFAQIDLQATALSGLAVIVALIVAWLVATARAERQPLRLAPGHRRPGLPARRRLVPLAWLRRAVSPCSDRSTLTATRSSPGFVPRPR
jgi:hypothetical protein